MSRFSERQGFVAAKLLQIKQIDADLRVSLWNLVYEWNFKSQYLDLKDDVELYLVATELYEYFHKRPTNTLPEYIHQFVEIEHGWFNSAHWFYIYDYCEFMLNYANSEHAYIEKINLILEREKSAYRMIDGIITPVVDEEQISAIQTAIDSEEKFRGAASHIKSALALYSNRTSPDYRNSVKESISAVESVCKILANREKVSLGEAIKIIESKRSIHSALKDALLKLYGYASDEKGIRHALIDEANVGESEARFMLVTCSAFVSYLISRQ